MAEIFRRDRKTWTKSEEEQIEFFYLCNEFFSKFYESRYFQEIVQMTYYAKVIPEQPLYLTNNKRPAAIVLLSGGIAVFKKHTESKSKKSGQQEYRQIGKFISYNQSLILSSECKVATLHGEISECLFVPSFLYHQFTQIRKQEKDDITFNLLSKVFRSAEKRPLLELVQAGSKIKELRFGSYIYNEGDKPESIYIILEGSAKIEKPGFSNRPYDIVVVSAQSLLGEKDITLSQRQTNAVCCTSHIRLLEIPKQPFIKFSKACLPNLKLASPKSNESSPKKQSSVKQSPSKEDMILPRILRFHSGSKGKSPEEEQKEYRLIKNSHILLDVPLRNKNKIRSRSSYSDQPLDIMEQKVKLYKKIRPIETKLDLSNRIF